MRKHFWDRRDGKNILMILMENQLPPNILILISTI